MKFELNINACSIWASR